MERCPAGMEEDVLEQFTLTSRNIVTEKMSRLQKTRNLILTVIQNKKTAKTRTMCLRGIKNYVLCRRQQFKSSHLTRVSVVVLFIIFLACSPCFSEARAAQVSNKPSVYQLYLKLIQKRYIEKDIEKL